MPDWQGQQVEMYLKSGAQEHILQQTFSQRKLGCNGEETATIFTILLVSYEIKCSPLSQIPTAKQKS